MKIIGSKFVNIPPKFISKDCNAARSLYSANFRDCVNSEKIGVEHLREATMEWHFRMYNFKTRMTEI